MKSSLAIWLAAIRPKTLPLACGAIFLGSGMAYRDGYFNSILFLLMLTTALLLQIISNLANDYGDHLTGADNEERVGPTRVMQSGWVSAAQMKTALFVTISLAIASGVALLYLALAEHLHYLLSFLALGALAIVAALAYTMPVAKRVAPYGYQGYGDIAVFVFFGLVAVIGSYTLYALAGQGDLSWGVLLPATSCGLLSAAVLNINNIRDLDTDKKAGKHTLVVKLGEKNARRYHGSLLVAAELSTLVYIVQHQLPLAAWLHLLALPMLILSWFYLPQRNNALLMNQQLKTTALMSFCYSTLLAVGHLF